MLYYLNISHTKYYTKPSPNLLLIFLFVIFFCFLYFLLAPPPSTTSRHQNLQSPSNGKWLLPPASIPVFKRSLPSPVNKVPKIVTRNTRQHQFYNFALIHDLTKAFNNSDVSLASFSISYLLSLFSTRFS